MSKRFHVHLHAKDLERSIGFYSTLSGAEPARREKDCAKWMLDDPKLNCAISTWGERVGIAHLGLQADRPAFSPKTHVAADACGAPRGKSVGVPVVAASTGCCG